MKAGFNVARLLPAQFFARYQFAENFTQSPERRFTMLRVADDKFTDRLILRQL